MVDAMAGDEDDEEKRRKKGGVMSYLPNLVRSGLPGGGWSVSIMYDVQTAITNQGQGKKKEHF
jgi:hypothetical protein